MTAKRVELRQQTCSDEIMRLQSDNASYQSQLQNAQGVSENRQCTIRQMNQDMETLRTTNEDLQTQLQTTRAILASTKQELSMLRTNHDYNKLETRCNQLKEQTRLQSQDLRTTRESLTAAQSKYSQACETITTLQTQLSNLREYSRLSDRPCQWSNKVFVFGSIDRPEVNGYYKLQPSFSTIVFKNNFNYSIREGPSNWYLLHESLYKGCPMYICPKREHHTRAAQSSSHRRSSCTSSSRPPEFGWRVNPDILSHTRTINNIMIFNMDSPAFRSREVSYLKERNQVLEEQYMSDYQRLHRHRSPTTSESSEPASSTSDPQPSGSVSAVVYPHQEQQPQVGLRQRRRRSRDPPRSTEYSGW